MFRPIHNPATGETIQFTATPQTGSEDVLRLDWRSAPGGEITEHFHPHQAERFTITSGEAHFTVNGEPRVVRAGETLEIPPGVRHAERTPGPEEVVGVIELRPALRMKEFFEALAGLASENKTNSRGAPKNPIQLGATIWEYRQEIRATTPPILIQNIGLPILWAMAKLCGVRAYHERWDSTDAQPTP